jgi:sarcosine oxidase subunit beta
MISKTFDVIVVGGGIIGLSTGYYLQRLGLKTIVVNAGGFACGSSGVCDDTILLQAKIPGPILDLAIESREIYRQLSEELDTDVLFRPAGGVVFIENQRDYSVMEEFVEKQRACGLEVTIIDRKELLKIQPYACESIIASTYNASDATVSPFRVMQGFFNRGRSLGMETSYHNPVTEIYKDAYGDWIVVTASGKRYTAPIVVNAAGSWAAQIGKMVDVDIPIVPKKGELLITEKTPPIGQTNVWNASYLVVKLRPELVERKGDVEDRLGYSFSLCRTAEGNYMLGNTREFVGFDKRSSYEAIQLISEKAISFFPVLRNVHIIRTIFGFRPASADGKMILGEHKNRPGFYTVAGHEGDGISMAPITGKLAGMLIADKTSADHLAQFSPERFAQTATRH